MGAITAIPKEPVDWGKVAGAGAKGAIVGAVAGATGGLSLTQYAFASAGANVVGGIAGRATEVVTNNAVLDWDPGALEDLADYTFDADSIMVDGIAGTVGGLAGKYAESQVIRQAANRYLNNTMYNRAAQTLRNIGGKSEKQINRAVQTVQSGINNFFWWVNKTRDNARAGATASATAAEKKKHKDVDCSNPSNRCKTDVTLK